MKKILAIVLVLVMALGCVASAEKLSVYHDYQTTANEMEYWLIQMSQGAKELNVLNNCFDGLVYNNNHGELVCLAAESYEKNEDATVWTFKLREDMMWADVNGEYKGDVTSADWITDVEWVLNYTKNESINTSMLFETLAGAQEYYDYTKELAETDPAAAQALTVDGVFAEMVGIKAIDEYTIEFTCFAPTPYFDTICTYACLYPIPQGMIDELGVEGVQGITPDKLWYSGPYTVTSFNHNSEKTLTKNPLYWNDEADLFDEVIITMVESGSKAYELFENGQLDHVDLTLPQLMTIYNDPSNPYYNNLVEARPTKYAYSLHFEFNAMNEDGTENVGWNKAIANDAFRLSMYYGVDLTNYIARVSNPLAPLNCTNWCYTGKGVAVNTQGVDYSDIVAEKLGLSNDTEKYARYDAEKAAAYKAQAIEELTAQGVEFPVQLNWYIPGNNSDQADTAKVLAQSFADCLGEDYIQFNIKTFVSSIAKEVRAPHLGCMYSTGWGADFGDPVNFMGQETYGEDNAYFSMNYSHINDATDETLIAEYKEFTELVNAAREITTDIDARYEAFAVAEEYYVSHAFVLPSYVNIAMQLTKVNDYTKIYAAYGISAYRYENWDAQDVLATPADYEAYKTSYENGEY